MSPIAEDALQAASGLSLHIESEPHWRVSWQEPDWLGPVGLQVEHKGTLYQSAPGADLPGAARTIRPTDTRRFDGSDGLGRYRGCELIWAELPLPLRTSVRAYEAEPLLVFRAETDVALVEVGTGRFERPSVAWPALRPRSRLTGGVPAQTRSYGHQSSEFALPVWGDENGAGFFLAPHRPPVLMPLLLAAPDGRTLLLAPLDQFHEQIIAVPQGDGAASDGIACGWHGDLTKTPPGFATEFALWAAPSTRTALETWAAYLRQRYGTRRPGRYADTGVGKLSYWTDNGAVYYYRTEPGSDYTTTLQRAVEDAHEHDVPVRAVQIDSWFYPHEHPRPVSEEGAPLVPPSGMMTWEPREDLFPDGFANLQRRLHGLPLTFHSRHFAAASPYFDQFPGWTDGDRAHPADGSIYTLLMRQAAAWGAITYEQDWMVESFLGVHGLRAEPGRARAWQEAMDRAAGEHGLTLQWCMSTPADFLQTLTLRHVTSIRTSGDYRYMFDNGLNWVWFLHTNALARALGLNPFKDVFLSHGATNLSPGEPYAEIEALLAALSTGPVAIGDQIGCTNRDLVMRTCREDGVLVKPDVPIAAIDRCFRQSSFFDPQALVGETYSTHPAGRWVYVATFNAHNGKKALQTQVSLADLGASRPDGPVLAYDWRSGTWTRLEPDSGWDVELPFQDFDYRVLCPLLPGNVTVFGDVSKYATVGDRRVQSIAATDTGIRFTVWGRAGTVVEIQGHAENRPKEVFAWQPGVSRELRQTPVPTDSADSWSWNAADGRWVVRVRVGANGHTGVSIVCR